MASEMNAHYNANSAQAATQKYCQERVSKPSDYSAQRQLDEQVPKDSVRIMPKPAASESKVRVD